MRPSSDLVFVTLLQVACSLTVISLTTSTLYTAGNRCYLSSNPANTAACDYAIAAGAVSIATAVLASCLKCLSCDCCGLGPVCSIVLAAFNSIWWLTAAAILTAATVGADAAYMRSAGTRHGLIAAAWAAAVVELAHSVLACIVVGNNVCNILFCIPATEQQDEEWCNSCCCSCCRPRNARHHHHYQSQHLHSEHAQPLLPGPAVAAATAAATTAALSRKGWWGAVQPRQQQQQHAAWPYATAAAAAPRPGAAAPAGGFMPPAPTAGQPFIYAPQQPQISTVGSQPAATTGGSSSIVQGFDPASAGVGHARSAAFSDDVVPSAPLPPPSAEAVDAPYAPPVAVRQQQQQQRYGAQQPPQLATMESYPSIPRE